MYKDIWAAAVGELLTCAIEPANTGDRYTVAVLRAEPYDRRCVVCSDIILRLLLFTGTNFSGF